MNKNKNVEDLYCKDCLGTGVKIDYEYSFTEIISNKIVNCPVCCGTGYNEGDTSNAKI